MSPRVFVGLDLGGKFHQVQITDANGARLGRPFRIGRGRAGLEALLNGVRKLAGVDAEPAFTVEATRNYWQEIVHPLQNAGHEVYLVSPDKSAGLRAFYRRHTKNDAIDAEATARLPAVDPRLHPRHRVDQRVEAIQRLVRQYWTLRGQIAARKKRILDRVTMIYPGYESVFRNRYCSASRRFIAGYLDPAKARRLGRARLLRLLNVDAQGHVTEAAMARLWRAIENAPQLDIQTADLQFSVNLELDLLAGEERVRRALRDRVVELYTELDPECRLTSIPGFGEFLGAAITAFIGDISRFRRADEVVALAGLCPRLRSSAGSFTPQQPITKHGDPTFRSCLYHAVQVTRQYDPEIQVFYAQLRARGKHHNVASCAAAAKLLRRCVTILREQRDYRITGSEDIQRKTQIEGKTIRASVFEVAERLRDERGIVLPKSKSTRMREAARAARGTTTGDEAPGQKATPRGRKRGRVGMEGAAGASDGEKSAPGDEIETK